MTLQSVCVYCGSLSGADPAWGKAAHETGEALARQGITIVYGGVGLGLMGALANGALAAGGRVEGIIPAPLLNLEVAHTGLSQLTVVADMHARKKAMAERADGFLALPGGSGTLDELFEIFTWAQLGFHEKPIGIFDVSGYWRPFHALIEHLVVSGFVKSVHAEILLTDHSIDTLLDKMRAYRSRRISKWQPS